MTNPSEENESKPFSVYEITKVVESDLTEDPRLREAAVIGEITDFTRHSSGHIYFTLKDKTPAPRKEAMLRCTFFRGANRGLSFSPKVGMEVVVSGSITVYLAGGSYQFNVRSMLEVGSGNLLQKIEQLRKRLLEEGIIDPLKRKPIPFLPKRIGIITGMQTAAFRDVLKQVHDRYPHVEILVAPARMQGEDSPRSVASALRELSKKKWRCDVILLTRGGGSPEDLMAFNDEEVARAIYESEVPVISAIGHQIDHPISDDVADLAAATPTDGAKQALPVISEELEKLESIQLRLRNLLEGRISTYREKLRRIAEKEFFLHPETLFLEYYQRLDLFEENLKRALERRLQSEKERLMRVKDLSYLFERIYREKLNQYQRGSERLEAFSPLAVLKRGYAIVYQQDQILRSIHQLDKEEPVRVTLADGEFTARPENN